ncbi:MAG: hypothetical protein K9W45_00310 [Candidatus Heimdallarchaeum aukensis]|uniref:NAD kinase n=1 Tax=Candidatus Heimdallarchaeum aukensis TaxID=2876573 RepID=A0A9Y1FLE5_9ARCH|nr:MAG: hypothetical protein K9W45_00310 [Candidatus Heimdallarchaeum aukensis]
MNILMVIAEEEVFRNFADTIKEQLTSNSDNISFSEITESELDTTLQNSTYTRNIKTTDLVISVGDTGTFLKSIFLSNGEKPVIAASSEKISFFTEMTPNNLEEAVASILSKSYTIDEYNRVVLQDAVSNEYLPALNEIAIFPNRSAQLMSYTLTLDNNYIYRGRADGIIVSTPLGSTGYALSANGPIAYGNPDITLIVPVNPLNKDHHPVVAPAESIISITNLKAKTQIEVIIDGQIRKKIDGQTIKILKARKKAKIVRISKNINIVSRLRNRLVELDLQSLEGVPPSAKYIFKLLHTEGEMTQSEIIQSTGLPSRTVRNALKILSEKGLIGKRRYLHDARQSIYFLI